MSAIEWVREPRRILLPVLVLAPFPITDLSGVRGRALMDTGSTVSGVSTAVADALGLARLGKRPLTPAQGQGQVERLAFRIAFDTASPAASEARSFPFVFEEVVGIELTNAFEFDLLLGMDILRQCDFSMTRDGRCRLSFG
jgi:hypothetical protein